MLWTLVDFGGSRYEAALPAGVTKVPMKYLDRSTVTRRPLPHLLVPRSVHGSQIIVGCSERRSRTTLWQDLGLNQGER